MNAATGVAETKVCAPKLLGRNDGLAGLLPLLPERGLLDLGLTLGVLPASTLWARYSLLAPKRSYSPQRVALAPRVGDFRF